MTIKNSDVIQALNNFADLLEAKGDNPYRIRAYRRAARSVQRLNRDLNDMIESEFDLKQIKGIGTVIANDILEIFKTKKIKIYRKNKPHAPRWKKEKSIKSSRIFRLFHVIPSVETFMHYIRQNSNIQDCLAVGDYRRKTELIKEVEILVSFADKSSTGRSSLAVKKEFGQFLVQFPSVSEIYALELNRVKIRLFIGVLITIFIVPKRSFGAMSLYYTGSKKHYRQLRNFALKKRFVLNTRGLYTVNAKEKIAGEKEDEIYIKMGLTPIPPELREDRGEIKAAQAHTLPKLITLSDIKGDLHCHTFETDGYDSIETMANSAAKKGYEYIAITDHSQHLAITNGLDKIRLMKQIKAIDKLNEKLDNIVILKSIEMDILADGSLDLPNSILKELDLTICSIHSQFRIPEKKQTERILRAMDNKYFNIWGHPTGRLIRKREPYKIDIERVLEHAKDRGCFFELNAQPYRLDINDQYCKMAKEMGVKLAISSDAHSIRELNYMQYGIFEARRGWLSAEDVINTRNLVALRKLIKRN